MYTYIHIRIYLFNLLHMSLLQCCGLGVSAPKPKPISFSLHHDVKSLACADDATLR